MKQFITFSFIILSLMIGCSTKKEEDSKTKLLKNLVLLGLISYQTDSPFSKYAIQDVDISRFVGKWNEYKRIDNSFQSGLTKVTAEYNVIGADRISVTNVGIRANGDLSQIVGVGIIRNLSVKGFLKVSFFPLFYSDYYILKIDNDYQYALIGGPVPNIFWILSKPQTVPSQIETQYIEYAKSIGYDTNSLKAY
jgi:apolipoprotein D and lipocalin family protein